MTEFEYEGAQKSAEIEKTLDAAVSAALAHEGADGTVALLVTNDETIWRMNREYRQVDRATDVLSFPAREGESVPADGDFLGDIAISLDRARAQAQEYGHSLERELSFLAVHGTLHLLGYDHSDETEKTAMFALQDKILEEMGVQR